MKRFLYPAFPAAQSLSFPYSILLFGKRLCLSAVLGLGLSGAAWASGPGGTPSAPVHVQAADEHSIRVRINNPTQQPGKVQVTRQGSGHVLFSEAYAAAAYGHRFDFRNLSAGRYVLLITVGPQQYRYIMQVQTSTQQPTVAIRAIKVRLPKAEALAAL
ncbi:hypothetical protein [Hymenobacter wooponensis]|uniref:Uncharacterized protein n=1 Tax=Hymenobacter wooponensis TaxID=1525360 RepID=A0A4Z0ME68_9BACT|nr:hypothetical protein [Hymenobacter wooponensis]TGD77816.1 hypothetical protein EU557_21210 [Hymenobacter wooponensis]